MRACGADGNAQPAVGYGYEDIGALSIHVPLAEASFSLVPLSGLVGDLPGSTLASTYEDRHASLLVRFGVTFLAVVLLRPLSLRPRRMHPCHRAVPHIKQKQLRDSCTSQLYTRS